MAKITLAVLDNKLENIIGDVKELKGGVKTTNGHLAKAVIDIAKHEEQIKAVDKKAELAYIKAKCAESVSKGYLKWIITIVLGNLLMFATILGFLTLVR